MTEKTNAPAPQIYVSTEIGQLRRIMIHRPDIGIGKIIPAKFQDWMYDDIVHLASMQKEYDDYIRILLYFLDPEKIKALNHKTQASNREEEQSLLDPAHPEYVDSDKVIDVQTVLGKLLAGKGADGQPNPLRTRLISAICAIEECSYETELQLHHLEGPQLAKTFITGLLPQDQKNPEIQKFLFAPVPNLVFTRDIGVVIQDHYVVSKACKLARKRESLLAKFLAYYHFFGNDQSKVIEMAQDSAFFLLDAREQKRSKVSLEGGDVMMISPRHVLVGVSERTTASAVNSFIHKIFSTGALEVEQITVIKIPPRRGQMHIDTVFTQVKRNMWVMFGKFSEVLKREKEKKQVDYHQHLQYRKQQDLKEEIQILQFYKYKHPQGYHPERSFLLETAEDYALLNQALEAHHLPACASKPQGLEDLLRQLSIIEFRVAPQDVIIIYSGNGIFPDDDREQWTDSCNLLALREGVVIGYNRNSITHQEFRKAYQKHYRRQGKDLPPGMAKGFEVLPAAELIRRFEAGEAHPDTLRDTLIELSSDELSRARGGSRCMSQPLLRDALILDPKA
ncbi:MAG: arginine deiminase family protein [Adhaeribacter sp.]